MMEDSLPLEELIKLLEFGILKRVRYLVRGMGIVVMFQV